MAFAKRKMPQIAGVEAAGEVAVVGPGVERFKVGDLVVMYGAETCGHCRACREGRDNLCEEVGGVMGFHINGFARKFVTMPARLVVKVPDGVDEAAVRMHLLEAFNIEIGAGLGPLAGKIWRVGLMGASSSARLILLLRGALESALTKQGHRVHV